MFYFVNIFLKSANESFARLSASFRTTFLPVLKFVVFPRNKNLLVRSFTITGWESSTFWAPGKLFFGGAPPTAESLLWS